MKAEDFVASVTKASPRRDELEAYGLDQSEIEQIVGAFTCRRRSEPPGPVRNELEALLEHYDCSKVEISFLRFVARPLDHPAGVQVALWEADPVVIRPSGEVVAIEHADPRAVICKCARDAEHFLDGLAVLLQAMREKGRWRGRVHELTAACAKAAGGQDYERFFAALSGFLGPPHSNETA